MAVDAAATTPRFYEFGSAIVATGSRPVELADLPFDGERVLDSTGALALDHVPGRLVVVGGGYIGVELGTAFAKLGAEVTIVELADQLLPGMPLGLARVVERALRARASTIRLGTKVLGLDGDDLVVEGPPEKPASRSAPTDRGRRATASWSSPSAGGPTPTPSASTQAGVRLDADGLIAVDADRRAAKDVYAIGDITAGPALAHKATAEAEVAVTAAGGTPGRLRSRRHPGRRLLRPGGRHRRPHRRAGGRGRRRRDQLQLPAVGLGPGPRPSAAPRATSRSSPSGAAASRGTVLGVHMVGAGVAELAADAALAIEMGATAEDLALTIAPHPTISEALAEAAKGAPGRPLHVRRRKERPSGTTGRS